MPLDPPGVPSFRYEPPGPLEPDPHGMPRPGFHYRTNPHLITWGNPVREGYDWFGREITPFLRERIVRSWFKHARESFRKRFSNDVGDIENRVHEKIFTNYWARSRDPGVLLPAGYRDTYAPWLRTVCDTAVVDNLRAAGRRQEIEVVLDDDLDRLRAGERPGRERWERVLKYLKTLDADSREIFIAYYLQGIPPAEIAAARKLAGKTRYTTEDAVRSRLRRIRLELIAFLEQEGPAEDMS